MYHSKKIGVFISHIYGKYQSELCQGIIDKAAEYGYLVEIFSSNDGENLGNYSTGESSILRIPNFEKFSGIIFASETYRVQELKDYIHSELEKCSCPIVEVNLLGSSFPSIALDNNSSIEQLVEHLITLHQHKRICYLGNSDEITYSDKRYEYYLKTMSEHHLPVSAQDYFCCDYKYENIEKALIFFLQNEIKPDAIVCYNDRMAFLMMVALTTRGYRIPQDIAITGFDTLDLGQNCDPPLTSVSFPVKELGFSAVETLLRLFDKEPIPPTTIVKAVPHIGGSCGCTSYKNDNSIFYSYQLVRQIETLENSMIEDMNMSATLHGTTDIDEGMDILEKYFGCIDNCRELYLCLYSNWDSMPQHIHSITTSEEDAEENTLILKFAVKNRKRLHECTFTGNNSLPDYIYEKSSSAYIYTPLFFGHMEFGYIALSYIDNQLSYRFNFMSWQMNVNSMLKHISDSRHMELLANQLEVLYRKDELTGFYNRHGFLHMAGQLTCEAQESQKALMVFAFHLDNLKMIYDTFGQPEGNFAVQVLAHALEGSLQENDLCARIEDGCFYVLTLGGAEEHALNFAAKVQKYLENYDRLHTKSYRISVRCGYSVKYADVLLRVSELLETVEHEIKNK